MNNPQQGSHRKYSAPTLYLSYSGDEEPVGGFWNFSLNGQTAQGAVPAFFQNLLLPKTKEEEKN